MTRAMQRRLDKLERQKHEVLSEASKLSSTDLRFRPDPRAWTALDVLDHLVKVEEASLQSVRKHLPKGASISFKDRL